jgi:polyhydroxyalkanoate synthesis regulator protein
MQGMLASFLEKSVETFLVQQDSLQAQISKMVANTPLATMADLTRQNFDALAKMQENVLSALLAKRERMRDEEEKRT